MEYRLKEALNIYFELYKKENLTDSDESRFLYFENFLEEYNLSKNEKMELINYFAEKEKKISKLLEKIDEILIQKR